MVSKIYDGPLPFPTARMDLHGFQKSERVCGIEVMMDLYGFQNSEAVRAVEGRMDLYGYQKLGWNSMGQKSEHLRAIQTRMDIHGFEMSEPASAKMEL